MWLEEIIDEKVIENCEINGACETGLNWLRRQPRTYGELCEQKPDWWQWLANNCSLPAVLEKLATDQAADVRRGVAQNANTPGSALEKLATDQDAYVRREAKKRIPATEPIEA
jgi:hypothetical protein